jgi:hypothetical protein
MSAKKSDQHILELRRQKSSLHWRKGLHVHNKRIQDTSACDTNRIQTDDYKALPRTLNDMTMTF